MLATSPSEDWGKARTKAQTRDAPENAQVASPTTGAKPHLVNRFPENKYEMFVKQQSVPRLANEAINYPLMSLRVYTLILHAVIIACVCYRIYLLSEKLKKDENNSKKETDPLPLDWTVGILLIISSLVMLVVESGPVIDAPRNFILTYFGVLRPYKGKACFYFILGVILACYHAGWDIDGSGVVNHATRTRDDGGVFVKESALMFTILGILVITTSIVYMFIGFGIGARYFPVE